MIQCPECRQMIPDDSAFCDQCGKELKWCPECKRPKRGTECPVCGADLIPGRKYRSVTPSAAEKSPAATGGPVISSAAEKSPADPGAPVISSAAEKSPAATGAPVISSVAEKSPAALVGNGWRLPLQEGPFGRRGGIWPELSSCQYVSGSHGNIVKAGADWVIEDVGSTNGTYVNGARIQRQTLKKGDRVKIATLEFTVE